jgi:hypothetical protein
MPVSRIRACVCHLPDMFEGLPFCGLFHYILNDLPFSFDWPIVFPLIDEDAV